MSKQRTDATNLNVRQKKFCHEYMIDMNGEKAAIRAGYSKNGAAVTASKLLINTKVSTYLRHLQQKAAEKNGVTVDRIIQELIKIGFSDIKEFIEQGNAVKDISELDSIKTAALESFTFTESSSNTGSSTSVKIKLHSKLAALEQLGRHLGMFKKDNEQIQPPAQQVNNFSNLSTEDIKKLLGKDGR